MGPVEAGVSSNARRGAGPQISIYFRGGKPGIWKKIPLHISETNF